MTLLDTSLVTDPPSGPPAALTPPVPLPPPSPPGPPVAPVGDAPAAAKARDPSWFRRSRWGLYAATAVAYLWGLGASGWANAFYSAAVQAGATSWKAFFFGSFDASNAITVDKPPAALWVMAMSVRLFGLSSWSILVPQALMGVGTVVLVVATVKRWFRPGAALLAGLVVALTPISALMFRFNNPDALLVLLLTASAYALTRALEHERHSTRWLALAGVLVGFGFLTKMLQAFVVLPVFALVYLMAGRPRLRTRLWQTTVMGLGAFAAAGWWVAIVELWPASSRPYIGGSQDNSVLELIFGYNGLGRLTGSETGSVGGGGGNGGNWGPTGWLRMFNSEFGGQVSWLIPGALVLLGTGLLLTIRRPRTDRSRAALALWGGWLLLTGILFSLSQGIIHPYYTVALAPAIGALVGIGASLVWDQRARSAVRLGAAAAIAVTAWWSYVLLGRSASWNPWLRPVVAVTGLVAAVVVAAGLHRRRLAIVGSTLALVAMLSGSAAYAAQTISSTHSGSLPTAGPQVAGSSGPGGGGPARGNGGPTGAIGVPPGQMPGATQGASRPSFGGNGGPTGGGGGGLLNASTPSATVVAALTENADEFTWVAAAVGSQSAAGYQLAAEEPVMSIGGFNGSDPSPTLAEFQAYVAAGRIHWFIAGGGMGGFGPQNGGSSASSEISSWVSEHFTATTIGGVTMYDLTAPASS